jgi:hypothetical protein
MQGDSVNNSGIKKMRTPNTAQHEIELKVLCACDYPGRVGPWSLSAISVLAITFLLAVPLVPFSESIALPDNLEPGWTACNSLAQHNVSVTKGSAPSKYQQCLDTYLYPPAQMTGSSTISYSLLGLGPQPYPREKLVTQGNESALVYFKGASIEAAELYHVPITSLDPPGLVRIDNQSLAFSVNDLLKFSAVVTNIGSQPMTLQVRIGGSDSAFSFGNFTIGGVNWMGANPVICPTTLAPNSQCLASYQAESNPGRNVTQFHLTVEVIGKEGNQSFLYQQRFVMPNPYTGQVNAEWVAAFMRSVNGARNGTSLQESKQLDDFAQMRFKTSVSSYTIANYGFIADYDKLFPLSGPQVGEATLFPGTYLPGQYASVLQQSAPGHWSILVDPTYTKYGYFVGEGPTVVARDPCPVTEFPSGGANMTEYLTSHGCAYDIVQGPWVVIEVEN